MPLASAYSYDRVGVAPDGLAFPRRDDIGLHLVFGDDHVEVPVQQFGLGSAVELRGANRHTDTERGGVGVLERRVGARARGAERSDPQKQRAASLHGTVTRRYVDI